MLARKEDQQSSGNRVVDRVEQIGHLDDIAQSEQGSSTENGHNAAWILVLSKSRPHMLDEVVEEGW